jgi:hypothetical protein
VRLRKDTKLNKKGIGKPIPLFVALFQKIVEFYGIFNFWEYVFALLGRQELVSC